MKKTIRRILAFTLMWIMCVGSIDVRVFAQENVTVEYAEEESSTEVEEVTTAVEEESSTEHEEVTTAVEEESSTEIEEVTTAVEEESSTEIEEVTTAVEEESSTEIEEVTTAVEEEFATEVEEVTTAVEEETSTDIEEETIEVEETSTIENEENTWDGITTEKVFEANDYRVTFSLDSYWEGGYNASIVIENTSDYIIENWYLKFDFTNVISNIWNAEIYSYDMGEYVIKNAGWNQDIAVGGVVEFGFSGNGKINSFPSNYEMLGESTQAQVEDYSVEYYLDSDWGSGFSGRIEITNHTDRVLEDWTLECDFNRNITGIWNATVESCDNYHYIIKNAGYNANIAAGQTVSFGFNGDGGAKEDMPQNIELYTYQMVNELPEETETEVETEERHGITWEEMTDTDNDGVPDSVEVDEGTDPLNPDTDGDKLSDYYELLFSCTNPLNAMTLNNGIMDCDLDPDEDGLTIYEEYLLETDALTADTDEDGLIDGEEAKIYLTNPLLYDTDADGISDGTEILLGLNPLNPATNGYADGEYQVFEDFASDSEWLADYNAEADDYKLSLSIQAKGDIYHKLSVRESAYTEAMSNICILGNIPEIIVEEGCELDKLTLRFQIDSANIYEEYSCEELKGIKRYVVFRYYEEIGFLLPIETEYNEATNEIFASADGDGTYCVMDMEKWLSSLGINIADSEAVVQSIAEEYAVSALSLDEDTTRQSAAQASADVPAVMAASDVLEFNHTIADDEGYNKDVIDMVFLLNTDVEGLTDDQFADIKYNIVETSKRIFYTSSNARIYILDPNGDYVKTSFGQEYATDILQLESIVANMKNERPTVSSVDEQFTELVNNLPFREEATKVAVAIGHAYMGGKSNSFPQLLADREIYTCIVYPNTAYNSLWYRIAKTTNGILVYDYSDFTDDLCTFIYDYVPTIPERFYKTVTSAGLKTIYLSDDLSPNNNADTDADGLTDWKEIDQRFVEYTEDGRVLLPTFSEVSEVKINELLASISVLDRFAEVLTIDGRTVGEELADIRILPLISNPTRVDGDEDGILDIDEWKYMDDTSRKSIHPLRKDTIETMYPKLAGTSKDASYLEVDDNNVTLHIKVFFDRDAGKAATSAFKATGDDYEASVEAEALERLPENYTFKDVIKDGIVQRWSGEYEGNEYDFFPGMNVNFKVDIVEQAQENALQRQIKVTVKDDTCGVCHQAGVDWKANCARHVTMYTSYCGNEEHEDKPENGCDAYAKKLYSLPVYQGTAAHEFGHVFGLKDLYESAWYNHGYEPLPANEIWYNKRFYFGLPQAGGIMKCNGKALSNDIEMILEAFQDNKWQYFVPYGSEQQISDAINEEQIYYNIADEKNYRWDLVNLEFEKIED